MSSACGIVFEAASGIFAADAHLTFEGGIRNGGLTMVLRGAKTALQ